MSGVCRQPPRPPLKRVADLLTLEQQEELRDDLRKIAEARRRGEAAAREVWL